MTNKKMIFTTQDRKYQMVYSPQRAITGRVTKLASFDLMKWCDRGDLGEAYVTINGYSTNYKPSEAFPLDEKIQSVMQMLVTDYNAAQWFAKLGAK